jgi:hypothetical protein
MRSSGVLFNNKDLADWLGPFIRQATTQPIFLNQGVYSALWFPSAVKR